MEKAALLVGPLSVEIPDYPDIDLLDARLENLLMALDLPPSLQDLDGLISGSAKNSKLFRAASKDGVRHTQEFDRIWNLPRRTWEDEAKKALALEMTEVLKTPTGTMVLKPDQAVALLEIGIHRGLLGPMRAGGGKTLVTFLAPYVLGAKRPVLIMPAKLLKVKRQQLAELAQHWRVAYWITMISYESLGRVGQKTFLEDLQCDCLIADESQKLKNPRAAVTKVVKRYLEKTKVPFISLSGTITKRSIQDYAPHAKWALHEKAPVPLVWAEVEEWGNAIDEKPRSTFRTPPGALTKFSEGGAEDLTSVRIGYQRRVIETPGVVATFDKLTDCSLLLNRVSTEAPDCMRRAYALLRKRKERLDGWAFASGIEIAQYARQLALGFYYRYNPWPPIWWLAARKAYASFSRYVLANNRMNIDSELQVRNAYDRGELDHYIEKLKDECGPDPLNNWRETAPKFKPQKEGVWLSDYAINFCAQWLEKPGIVWCEHVEFAERLAEVTGAAYCGAGGVDKNGTPIEHLAGQPVIASIRSSGEGRDLQHGWNRSLVTASLDGGAWEQLLARMHRDGQLEDEVYYDVLSLCAEHESGWAQALEDSRYIEETTKQPQRLRYADLVWDFDPLHPGLFDPIFNRDAVVRDPEDLPLPRAA